MAKTIKERFYEKVGLDWQWRSRKNKAGYGDIQVNGKHVRAHRLSYEIHNGKIPAGMYVLHSCDDPGCVNPEHLHLGTPADNMREMVERNRNHNMRGENNPNAKITEKQVIEIREKYKKGMRQIEICKEYDLQDGNVSDIVNRKKWKYI